MKSKINFTSYTLLRDSDSTAGNNMCLIKTTFVSASQVHCLPRKSQSYALNGQTFPFLCANATLCAKKNTSAIRETGVSQYTGGEIKGTPPITRYNIARIVQWLSGWGGINLSPMIPRDAIHCQKISSFSQESIVRLIAEILIILHVFFWLLTNWNEYGRGDSFPFYYTPNGISYCSYSKENCIHFNLKESEKGFSDRVMVSAPFCPFFCISILLDFKEFILHLAPMKENYQINMNLCQIMQLMLFSRIFLFLKISVI